MPRLRVIVLGQTADDPNSYNVIFWADVPVARQAFYARAGAVSAWSGATAGDNTSIADGAVVEKVGVYRYAAGTTLAAIQAFLQAQWQVYQTAVTNNNPWIHYGSTWDGNTWDVVTVN